ncbi:MAG: endonuclease MutS2, partial [Deltaproteobacteria bacterium]
MDLLDRTLAALDWSVVLQALSTHARTTRGATAALQPRFCTTLQEVGDTYAAVLEVRDLEAVGERVPVGAVTDIAPLLERAARGLTLEGAELQAVAACLDALVHLRTWVEERDAEIPRLRLLAMPIEVDGELHGVLSRSFDAGAPPELGGLSGREYPELARLHAKVESLRSRIRSTLDELVRTGLGDALQDRYVTQRDGRFVVPVRADRRRGLGIVHGRSQSGETVYVEPAAVVELHNEMEEAARELHREVGRILGVLSRMVGRFAEPLQEALDAAEAIDLVVARAGWMRALQAVVPAVGDDGVVSLRAARHPVLVLRGIDVVPHDLGLDDRRRGLVLSGPNTGGKTIALKTLGLAALMVRAGIPVPCAEGSRVDFFSPVVADVGDWQSVEGDLSTFSGHVAVLRAVLDAVRPDAPHPALVLLDELGMGTDPAQGAALARAVLEALVERGARVAVTTHYTELKALAAVDPRFEVAAVAIEDGQPTYQLLWGTAGESHALAIAAGLDLDPAVLERARSLLSRGTREVSDLVQKLEEERSGLARQRRELEARAAAIAEQEAALRQREEKLEERRRTLEERLSARFQARMKAREQELKQTISLLQARPDLRT